jgi:hypothetical protein
MQRPFPRLLAALALLAASAAASTSAAAAGTGPSFKSPIAVKYYFIEDKSPTAAEQIPQSLNYLEQVRW